MKSESFREILKGLMNEIPLENEQNPPSSTQVFDSNFSFSWSFERPIFQTKNAYPRGKTTDFRGKTSDFTVSPPTPKKEVPLEPEWEWHDLTPEEQGHIETFFSLGAEGSRTKMTRSKVKRWYRQLAKRLHPDVASRTPESKEGFLRLQKAYESLIQSFKKR